MKTSSPYIIVFYAHFDGVCEKKKRRKKEKVSCLCKVYQLWWCGSDNGFVALGLISHQTPKQLVSLPVLCVI